MLSTPQPDFSVSTPGIGNRCLSYSFQTFAHVISRILVSVTIQLIILVFQTEVYYGIVFFFFADKR